MLTLAGVPTWHRFCMPGIAAMPGSLATGGDQKSLALRCQRVDALGRGSGDALSLGRARARLPEESAEDSNESSVSSMADEVNTSRQFEMTMKVIEAFNAIDHSAANDLMSK